MKKFVKTIFAIFTTAWYGALTLFCFAVFGTALMCVADRLLNNDIVSCVVLGMLLVGGGTVAVGNIVKDRSEK